MIKVKHGIVKMKGSEDRIFTDTVNALDAFCESMDALGKGDKTAALCAVIMALHEEKGGYDYDKIRYILKEAKNDD